MIASSDPRWKTASKWAYQGTRKAVLPAIAARGLLPGSSSSYGDNYSEYDDGQHLFFSEDPTWIRGNYGDTLLRFPWPSDAKPDMNTYGRVLPHQFATKHKIAPKDIEVEIDSKWIGLGDI